MCYSRYINLKLLQAGRLAVALHVLLFEILLFEQQILHDVLGPHFLLHV